MKGTGSGDQLTNRIMDFAATFSNNPIIFQRYYHESKSKTV